MPYLNWVVIGDVENTVFKVTIHENFVIVRLEMIKNYPVKGSNVSKYIPES